MNKKHFLCKADLQERCNAGGPDTGELRKALEGHCWQVHLPRHTGDGHPSTTRNCAGCPAIVTVAEEPRGALIAVRLITYSKARHWARDRRNQGMNHVSEQEYRRALADLNQRTSIEPAPAHWMLNTGDGRPARRIRAIPKNEVPAYPGMNMLHAWMAGECLICGTVRTAMPGGNRETAGIRLLAPTGWAWHYVRGINRMIPASLETFAEKNQLDYALESVVKRVA